MGAERSLTFQEASWLIRSKQINRRKLMFSAAVGAAAVAAGSRGFRSASAQDQITLSQWYHQYGEAGTEDAAKRYAAEYTEANPNVKVEVNWVLGDYAGAELPAALLTDQGPDVFEGFPNVSMVKANQCIPLDDLYTDEVKADFHPNNLATNTINGKIYAVKMIDDMGLLYYRKSILEEAGVAPPTTWDELVTAAATLTTGRVKGLFLGNDGGISALQTIGPWSAGSDFVDVATNKVIFDNERTVAAYTKLKELNATDSLLIGSPTDWWDPSAFTQGLAAMQWTGLWAMPGITSQIQDDFGVVPWPAFDAQGTPATFWGGWSEMVNGKSKNIDAAKAFVKWLWIDNTANQQDWSLSYGFHVPPRQSAAAAAEPLKTGPASEAVTFLGQYGKILPPIWTGSMGTILLNALTEIVKNGADAAATVSKAQVDCQAELDRSLAP